MIAGTCFLCPGGGSAPTYVWVSNDNGASFGAPRVMTVFTGGNSPSDGLWLDDLGSFVGTGPRVGATNSPTASTAGIEYAPGGSFFFDPDVVRLPGTNRMVAAANDLDTVRYAVYTGAGTVTAMNNPANWLIGRSLSSPETGSENTALSAGPNGAFLSYRAGVAGVTRVGLRRFDPATNTFGAATYVEGDDPIDRQTLGLPVNTQDPAGRIHVIWRVLFSGNRLRYRVSDPGVTTFTPAAGNIPPKAGVSAVLELVAGDVRVKQPESTRGFVPLKGIASVPVGSIVDARKGILAVQTAANGFPPSSRGARRQNATLRAGIFRIRQQRARRKRASVPTGLALRSPAGAEAKCARAKGGPPRKGVVRSLAIVAKGRVRAFAGAGTATTRKATFTVTDRCDGTLIRVTRGRVAVEVKGRKSDVNVRAGHSRLIKARLFAIKRRRG